MRADMKTLITLIALLGLMVWPRMASAQQKPEAVAQAVDTIFAEWNRAGSPGAALVIVKDGAVLYQKGYGFANLDYDIPITAHTRFDIASVSKHFTAFAIAMLADQGRLSIDDDVRKHIPELPDFGRRIQIRHLVHHTSGIRDWVELLSIAGFRFDDVIAPTDIMTFMRHQQGLNFEPGAEYLYSNTGYNLLAEIVARASGQSFADFMQQRIFKPLGMNDTHILIDHQRVEKNRATSYAPNENIGELRRLHFTPPPADGSFRIWVDNTSAPGSSSVVTTVADMAKWLRNWETGEIGGARVLEQMVQRGVLNDGRTIDYAFGVSVDEWRKLTAISHGGGWRGFRTHLLRLPQERLGIVVLGNSTSFDAGGTATRVAAALLRNSAAESSSGSNRREAPTPPQPLRLTAEQLAEYGGVYHSAELGTSYTATVTNGQLVLSHRKMDDQILTAVATDRFTTAGVRGQLTFEFARDANRRVTGYTLRGARFRGVRFDRDVTCSRQPCR